MTLSAQRKQVSLQWEEDMKDSFEEIADCI